MRRTIWRLYAFCYDSIACLLPYRQMVKDIVDKMCLVDGNHVLDAGCGTGNLQKEIVTRNLEVEVRAIDFSKEMLNRAIGKKLGSNITYKCVDITKKLPFSDSLFDVVVSSNVIYTLKNGESIISELNRVLKPGGLLIISDPKKGSKFMMIFWSHLFSGG